MRHRRIGPSLVAFATAVALTGLTLPGTPASGAPGKNQGNGHGKSDVRPVGPDYNNGKALRVEKQSQLIKSTRAHQPVRVGQVRTWLALDDAEAGIYLKPYKLRGIGEHIEIWVAQDTKFPKNDCRNPLGLTEVTDAQVRSFIHEFDTNIYPTESAAFSTPPDRDGSNASLPKHFDGLPRTQFQGDGDNIVVLVDNVRDANFYDPSTPSGQTYIAGFFYSTFNEYTDRNIMTIDAYDWLHRTGATPPDDSADPAYDACAAASGAPRPHLYEGTFAHEYQHLLEYYEDPDETSWVNEGLSDYAQTMVGYVDTSVPVTDPTADSHIACFSGFLAEKGYGGPENSLTMWEDQGGPEVLCDYGAAYSFMQYLHGHFGEAFLSDLHREDANGLEGLQNVLNAHGADVTASDLVHRWLATMALDNVLDAGATLTGGDAAVYSEESLGAQINWDAVYDDINHDGTRGDVGNEAYSTPGAPNNGADYVKVDSALTSLEFSGAAGYEPEPMKWTSVADPAGGDDLVLFSGRGDEIDHSMVLPPVTVGENAELTFDTRYNTEPAWDFFFVQVSSDDGDTWESLPIEGTTSEFDPQAYPTVQENVPGFTGDSGGWVSKSYDLSAYAGQEVLLNFRYVTDWGTNLDGVWVDDVKLAGTSLLDGSSVEGLRTMTQVNPVPVAGWTVQVVAHGEAGAWIGALGLAPSGDQVVGSLTADQLAGLQAATGANRTVGVLVTADDPTESARQYARYTLTVDGEVQPGG